MNKIVILTNSFKKSCGLAAFLRMLFPGCEIEMQSGMKLHGEASGMPEEDSEDEKLDGTRYR